MLQNNTKWIEKVSVDCLSRSQLTVIDFIKGLKNGTIMFDKLCITLACRAFNIHCVVLLDGAYWSKRPNNDFTDWLLKIAYIGDFGFKELCTESTLLFGEHESKDSEYLSDIDDDLQDTGLFGTDNGVESHNDNDSAVNEEQMGVKPPIRLQCSFTTTTDEPIVLSDEEQLGVKPTIRLPCSFSTNADEPIVLSDDKPVEQVDVKPLICLQQVLKSQLCFRIHKKIHLLHPP